MAVEVLSKQYVMIGDFLMDVSLNEDHSFESEVTEYPVETGATVTDNIRPRPITISMECLVTNTPIGPIRDKRGVVTDTVDNAYEHLLKIYNAREPVVIRTSLRTFENMALTSLSIPRATGRGDDLRFTASFQQVQLIENKRTRRVAVPAAKGKKTVVAAPKVATGKNFYLIPSLNKWLDQNIGAWREYVYSKRLVSAPVRPTEDDGGIEYIWVLDRGVPDTIAPRLWRNSSEDQKRYIEAQLIDQYKRTKVVTEDTETQTVTKTWEVANRLIVVGESLVRSGIRR